MTKNIKENVICENMLSCVGSIKVKMVKTH